MERAKIVDTIKGFVEMADCQEIDVLRLALQLKLSERLKSSSPFRMELNFSLAALRIRNRYPPD